MRLTSLVYFILVLAACGGGGGESNSPKPTPPVIIDTTPPEAPTQTISDNADGTIKVSGSAEANSSVMIVFPDGTSQNANATQNGNFGPVTSATPQPNGIISTTATDSAGNQSTITQTNYIDTTAPVAPTLIVVVNSNNTVSVEGIAEVNSLVNVFFQDGTTGSTTSQENGTFSQVTSAVTKISGEVSATSTDAAGNVSSYSTSTFKIPPENALWELAGSAQAKDIVRFLTQSTFGPNEDSIQALVASEADYETWLNEQLAVQPTNLLEKFEQRLREAGLPVTNRSNLDHVYHKQLLASDMLWDTFAYGDDQLRQRVAFALSQIFVVSETSDPLFNNARGVVAYHDLLARNALGNYRDLIEALTLNPIMGEYLSMIRNEKANNEENIRPDENYARELMQLFSIGLELLNQDGTPQLDQQGQTIPTYDQNIVKAFARVFTGWTYNNANIWNYEGWLLGNMIDSMKFFEAQHDTDEKQLLNGQVLPAGQSPLEDLQGALENLFNHQNVPPFISKQLIQRLVTSNPSGAYVERISAVFRDNGEGIRGDLGAVVKAILLDDEARTGHLEKPTTFGKLKEPVLKFTALIRAFDVVGLHPINEEENQQPTLRFYWPGAASGQRPYGSPSVFNFFRPDHSPAGPIRDAGLVSPELQILNESFITETINYGSATIFNSYDFLIDDCQPRLSYLDGFGCPYPDFSDERALANNTGQLLSRLNLLMLAGEMTDITADALTGLAELQTEPRFAVAEVVHLIYLSPEFAVQR